MKEKKVYAERIELDLHLSRDVVRELKRLARRWNFSLNTALEYVVLRAMEEQIRKNNE